MPPNTIPPEVLDALARGQVIEAVKLLRQSSGLGLKEAKDAIDRHLRSTPAAATRPTAPRPAPMAGPLPPTITEALRRGNKIEAIRLMREHTGSGLKEAKDAVEALERTGVAGPGRYAPGEVPRSGSARWLVPALVFGGMAAWYFLRGPG